MVNTGDLKRRIEKKEAEIAELQQTLDDLQAEFCTDGEEICSGELFHKIDKLGGELKELRKQLGEI
jgi:uncharacterized protein YceH (UPF0502 family)